MLRRREPLLYIDADGFVYYQSTVTSNKRQLRCKQFRRLQCRGRASMFLHPGAEITLTQGHNHAPDAQHPLQVPRHAPAMPAGPTTVVTSATMPPPRPPVVIPNANRERIPNSQPMDAWQLSLLQSQRSLLQSQQSLLQSQQSLLQSQQSLLQSQQSLLQSQLQSQQALMTAIHDLVRVQQQTNNMLQLLLANRRQEPPPPPTPPPSPPPSP